MNKRKLVLPALVSIAVATSALAHEGGHGPEEGACGNNGGQVSAERNAELVMTKDGNFTIYPCGKGAGDIMKKSAKASSGAKGKMKDFAVTFDGDKFTGKAPDATTKPYDIVVTVGGKKATFKNLE